MNGGGRGNGGEGDGREGDGREKEERVTMGGSRRPDSGAAPPVNLAPGPRVGDRIGAYRLVRLLGEGASGPVFEVVHERLGRRAAMKTLAAEHASHPGAIKRLFAEALAVNRINHPHIVEITDLVEAGEHQLARGGAGSLLSPVNAIVMELLEGESLGHAMTSDGPLDAERFLPVMAQVCRALAAAHGAGFVHRDLKPDNVFLADRGRDEDFVKLLDFGLTKPIRAEPSLSDTPLFATMDGTFVGTPGYVSPEQASGRPVDHRSDIYAVGVTLYELICGHLPFEAPSVGELLIHHVSTPAPHLPDDVRATKLGAMLDAVIQRCLEKDPELRFSSASRLARLFDDLAGGGDPTFTGAGSYLGAWASGPPRPPRREVARAAVGLGIGLLLALGVALVAGHLIH
jgi:serine/threonine protein kinase